ncbi:MAG: SpoIIE family protein phosphatase [Alkaliphilus sp.]|nr:SpoIIE family protein phosphatase [Alkaliphilus sp.]
MNTYKILILDLEDNPLTHVKELLRKHGYEVVQKLAGHICEETILKEMPHVILTNCFCDEKYKLELCDILKDNYYIKKIPVIVVFKELDIEDKKKLISMDIDDYISFPFEEIDLIFKIQNQAKLMDLQKQLTMSQKALEENLQIIKKQKRELERDLNLAAKIQEALIPKSFGDIPNCSFNCTFQPSGRVGGDIFDVFMLDDDNVGIYMLDVMGHGVASSMLAVILSETLILDVDRGSPLKRKTNGPPYYEIITPLEVVNYLNERFVFGRYSHYFTIFYMVLNVRTGMMKYVRAGHPTPLLVKGTGEILELDAYGTPVGFEFSEEYEEKTIYLDSGDHLIIYTDGLMEIKDKKGGPIELDGIIDCIQKDIDFASGHLIMGLNRLIREQTSLKDDLSIIEMRWARDI